MPIYAYRCATCGHAKDVLQRISDPLLTVCPACGAAAFKKQVTAAGFQLKGSGWYVTDFKGDGNKASKAPVESSGGDAGKGEAGKGEAGKGEAGKGEPGKPATETSKPAEPAATAKPATSDKAAAPAPSTGGTGGATGG